MDGVEKGKCKLNILLEVGSVREEVHGELLNFGLSLLDFTGGELVHECLDRNTQSDIRVVEEGQTVRDRLVAELIEGKQRHLRLADLQVVVAISL